MTDLLRAAIFVGATGAAMSLTIAACEYVAGALHRKRNR
jgi:hypothetical protein